MEMTCSQAGRHHSRLYSNSDWWIFISTTTTASYCCSSTSIEQIGTLGPVLCWCCALPHHHHRRESSFPIRLRLVFKSMQIGTIQAPLRCSLPPELLTLSHGAHSFAAPSTRLCRPQSPWIDCGCFWLRTFSMKNWFYSRFRILILGILILKVLHHSPHPPCQSQSLSRLLGSPPQMLPEGTYYLLTVSSVFFIFSPALSNRPFNSPHFPINGLKITLLILISFAN